MDKAVFGSKQARFASGNWILILLFCISSSGCKQQEPVRIIFTGDILLSRNVEKEMENRKCSPWINFESLFHSCDLVVGNLEGSVGDKTQDNYDNESPYFSIDVRNLSFLSKAGFNVLSIENNHSFDNGEIGKLNTAKQLIENRISPVTFSNSPQFFHLRGISVSIVGINLIRDRADAQQTIPSIEIKQKLRLAKSLSNLVVVFIHWGSELLEWPNQDQRESAKWLIDNGADLIIGSHPHVIQKPEVINGKPVFFSLGNHLFDQKYPPTKIGLIADCRIEDGFLMCNGISTKCNTSSFFPVLGKQEQFDLPRIKLHEAIAVPDLNLAAHSLPDGTIKLEGVSGSTKYWETVPKNLVSLSTSTVNGEVLTLSIEKHYSNMDHSFDVRPYVYSISRKRVLARWRGSALAWPLIDADFLPHYPNILCALHKGNSFVNLAANQSSYRVSAYRWNGFGFSGIGDSAVCKACETYYQDFLKK